MSDYREELNCWNRPTLSAAVACEKMKKSKHSTVGERERGEVNWSLEKNGRKRMKMYVTTKCWKKRRRNIKSRLTLHMCAHQTEPFAVCRGLGLKMLFQHERERETCAYKRQRSSSNSPNAALCSLDLNQHSTPRRRTVVGQLVRRCRLISSLARSTSDLRNG